MIRAHLDCPAVLLVIHADDVNSWFATHGLRIAVIVISLTVCHFILARIVPPAIRRAVMARAHAELPGELEKRAHTLSSVTLFVANVAIVTIGLFMVLGELGYNLAPVITGLGITGIAIGLGAQGLVRDSINGILILAENQFRYGDFVTVAGVSGTVEDINLRRTVLRDIDGTVHTIPNGAIQIASNHTRDYSGINVVVLISHNADLERALEIATETGAEMANKGPFDEQIVDPPRPARIEGIDHLGVSLRILGRVRPGRQGAVAFEYRWRLLEALDAAGLGYTASAPAPARPGTGDAAGGAIPPPAAPQSASARREPPG